MKDYLWKLELKERKALDPSLWDICEIVWDATLGRGLPWQWRLLELPMFFTQVWAPTQIEAGSNTVLAPYQPEWLRIIGTIFFLLNIALFIMNAVCLTLKFWWNPGSFKASFKRPSESLFTSAWVSSSSRLFSTSVFSFPLQAFVYQWPLEDSGIRFALRKFWVGNRISVGSSSPLSRSLESISYAI